VKAFQRRFGVMVVSGYGSSENAIVLVPKPGLPPDALGVPGDDSADIAVVDAETMVECPRATFDDGGRLTNGDVAIGEIVGRNALGRFEGYYNNPEATEARARNGWYWSGDLGYRDADGVFYFAGRTNDWLRVDGENFASAPIERILQRHPDIVLASVYAVPDMVVGDQVMAAVQLRPGLDALDGEELLTFLAAQGDLGTKWTPRFVRMSAELPATATNKVLKRSLRAERWNCEDTVLWQSEKGGTYRVLDAEAAATLEAAVGDRPI
jgi:fatty-acyl-CoA synthase